MELLQPSSSNKLKSEIWLAKLASRGNSSLQQFRLRLLVSKLPLWTLLKYSNWFKVSNKPVRPQLRFSLEFRYKFSIKVRQEISIKETHWVMPKLSSKNRSKTWSMLSQIKKSTHPKSKWAFSKELGLVGRKRISHNWTLVNKLSLFPSNNSWTSLSSTSRAIWLAKIYPIN